MAKLWPSFSVLTGGASYALYLGHPILLLVWWHLGGNQLVSGLAPSLAFVVFLSLTAAMVALSVIFYVKLERPLHRGFRKLLRV